MTEVTAKNRVEIELLELQKKRQALATFLTSGPKLTLSQQAVDLMAIQFSIMEAYIGILQMRLVEEW